MPTRSSAAHWQSKRKHSLGPLRRAHPASGATWNVQVVRGRITSRCLWHACRALAIGIVLMLLGAGMATIGYYADELSIGGRDLRSNSTVRVKNEPRGTHLNNLSYVGPIIMGFGGFIVVAACVMTFEARDSAAKVVPARFKLSTGRQPNTSKTNRRASSSRKTTGRGNASWDHHLGVFRTSPACESTALPPPDRQSVNDALIHFSKTLGSPSCCNRSISRRISRSGSVPNLTISARTLQPVASGSPVIRRCSAHHHRHHPHRTSRSSGSGSRSSKGPIESSRLLHPGMLQFHRQAVSFDEEGPNYMDEHTASGYMAVEVHESDASTKARIKERSKRSDTAKRHVLSRQNPIEKIEEPHSPRAEYNPGRRRSSTASDASINSNRLGRRRASSVSRTPSLDSRSIHTSSAVDINATNSPDKYYFSSSPRSPRRNLTAQFSTPSVEREFKNQLSVCSDPTVLRTLSCQSSIEPCVPEEDSPEEIIEPIPSTSGITFKNNRPKVVDTVIASPLVIRPDTLNLDNGKSKTQKFLYRSNSTKLTKPKLRPKLDSALLDQIYYIGNRHTDDDNFDSIEVIDERRRKNFIRNNAMAATSISTAKDDDVTIVVDTNVLSDNNNMVNLQRTNADGENLDIRNVNVDEGVEQTMNKSSRREEFEIEIDEVKSNAVGVDDDDGSRNIINTNTISSKSNEETAIVIDGEDERNLNDGVVDGR